MTENPHPAHSPHNREPLTRERIIEAALRIVDGQGLSRLTMRRLGDALEVEAMAIYHHLPRGKEELLDGLVAYVGAHPLRASASGTGWRERLAGWAQGYRALLLEHAGVLPLLVTRRNPAALAATTASLQEELRQAGFPETAGATGAHTLVGFLIGHAALEARGRALRETADIEDIVDWDQRFTDGLAIVLRGLG
jgi:TetR/AcrR family tetracycline transcriptional repressor